MPTQPVVRYLRVTQTTIPYDIVHIIQIAVAPVFLIAGIVAQTLCIGREFRHRRRR